MQLFIHLSQNDKYSQHKILISKIIKLYSLNDRYMMSEVPYLFYFTKKNPKSKQNKMSDTAQYSILNIEDNILVLFYIFIHMVLHSLKLETTMARLKLINFETCYQISFDTVIRGHMFIRIMGKLLKYRK